MEKRSFLKHLLFAAGGLPAFLAMKHSRAANLNSLNDMLKTGTNQQRRYFKEAYHYLQFDPDAGCELCPNHCIIRPGKKGSCRTRINQDGKLMTMAYGNPAAVHIDPVEKKPLFHVLPSSRAYSIATAGCVLSCLNCQNWDLSQASPDETDNIDLMPTQVVEQCILNHCESIAYTYSEPTAWYEYAFDTARIAKARGIRNLWISCGYINEKPLRELAPYIDAANINLKSFSEEIYQKLNGGSLEPVLRTLKILKEMGVWLEITNLVVPTWTDDMAMIRRMCAYLVKEGFSDNPLHIIRFFPQYKLTQLPATPVAVLEQARSIALEEGMKYVYVGNVPGTDYEDTFCPSCKRVVINRRGFRLLENNLTDGKCKFCHTPVAGLWL
ncbi:MAG TPA: AmmeMemoRadiSam system radical SAM enzyme [Bacteroidales bacterium]|nr:AmmeMemoRadiSam system radical SAM enzyme [Bacteroidales bacterium]HSA44185.1 AmmeMemoRadiSam system radical SAM enzyme [Bacteroidales bacterium]